ncbi:hypothetical protein GNF10_26485 [Nostoc sp. UCD121]|uniref:hypothetical protein n=1 Tax=unclassified Nostoc TaxID=2593658 RepID=UPI001626EF51|nr:MULTISPECIES: hypothetical protein [unclassified Nostoc]MBC1221826.1 hypothetical protein [Nostoc sp. UCD120]MBC1279410.1 hypothetical protein [Nostoc sp. UCD121]MBC1295919.1 hypothetical protein [Nostoc sp. UCD122]
MKTPQHTGLTFEKLIAEMAPEVSNTFTAEQLEGIKRVFNSRIWTRHSLDIRVSVPIPGLRFYLVLLAGSERRSKTRLRSEKGLYPFWTPANTLFVIVFLMILSACSYTIFSVASSSLTPLTNLNYPTSIPWIDDKSECERTNRVWNDGKCWDSEHSPNF